MGNQQYQGSRTQSSYTQWDSPRFQQFSGIEPSRLAQINQEFRRTADSDGLVSGSEFNRLYSEFNLGPKDENSVDRAFRTFDVDQSGKLSFDEFLSSAIMLNNKSNPRERIDYLIESNNPSGFDNTYITPAYGRTIIRNMNQFYGTNANFDDIWSEMNANNGLVRREEFVTYMTRTPTFISYF
jgi:Ca2+-binding EF-hand superfamily protein